MNTHLSRTFPRPLLGALGLWAALAMAAAPPRAPEPRVTLPPPQQKPVNFSNPPRDCTAVRIRNGEVLVETQLLDERPELGARALARLDEKLTAAFAILPPAACPRLRKLTFFLMYGVAATNGGRNNGLEYFQRTAPDHYRNLDPRMRSSILIYSAPNYVWLSDFWALKALVHELAHAHHLEQWPETRPDLYDAWKHAVKQGLYHNVKDAEGHVIEKAYAAVNQLEYFAELSCAYFVGCNYYPFNREQLKAYDPVGYAVVRKLWGIADAPEEAAPDTPAP